MHACFQTTHYERGRDIIRNIRNDFEFFADDFNKFLIFHFQNVFENHFDVIKPRKRFVQHRLQRAVNLERIHLFRFFGNRAGERACARSYFDNDVVFVHARKLHDFIEEIFVRDEILPEIMIEPKTVVD